VVVARATHTLRSRVDAAPGRLRYEPSLDGVRGVAILAVMAFHAGMPWAIGGFLGVDVFSS